MKCFISSTFLDITYPLLYPLVLLYKWSETEQAGREERRERGREGVSELMSSSNCVLNVDTSTDPFHLVTCHLSYTMS